MIELLISSYLFFVGAVFGSFAGAMVWRLKTGKKLANERSECEQCHHKLSWLDLIPIVSWLALGGKCRYCRKPIGWSPLMLELGLGAIFVISYLAWPYSLDSLLGVSSLLLWLVAVVMLAILFVYDLRWYLLPDKVMWPLIVVGGLLFAVKALLSSWGLSQALIELVLCLIPVSGVYYLLYTVSQGRWVGFGDVKLGIFIGLALGWQGALVTLVLANFIGLFAVLPGLVSGKLSRSSEIPFGPFLIIATMITMLAGDHLVRLYVQVVLSGSFS